MTRNTPLAWTTAVVPGVIVSLVLSVLAQPLRSAELPEPAGKKSCHEASELVTKTGTAKPCDAVSTCVVDQCRIDACAKNLCTAKACAQAECRVTAAECCTLAEKPCPKADKVHAKHHGHPVVTRIERGVPMLRKIPYVNRLFKNVGIAGACPVGEEEVCHKQIAASECSPMAILPKRADSFHVDGSAVVHGELVLPGPVRSAAVPQAVTSVRKNKAPKSKAVYVPDTATAPYPQPVAAVHPHPWPPMLNHPWSPVSMIHFEQFQLETLNAVYEARLEALQRQTEMMEELVELRVRNAQLEAQLTIAEHRQEMLQELAKMHVEQARLQAQVEFASATGKAKAAVPPCSQDSHPLKPRVTRKLDESAGEKVH